MGDVYTTYRMLLTLGCAPEDLEAYQTHFPRGGLLASQVLPGLYNIGHYQTADAIAHKLWYHGTVQNEAGTCKGHYYRGLLHNTDGPARTYENGTEEYYYAGTPHDKPQR